MGRVYFSNVENAGSLVKDNDSGIMHIILIPKKWWSIKHWKVCIDFKKHFVSGFITNK